ncbi:MAG: hypothetical protein LUG55_02100 [Clostridiales bacterium]|nr:hypothetical protein [Clostridiales bacterium]
MTTETKRELIKAFAYGLTAEKVADVEGLTLEEAVAFEKANANEIQERQAELKEAGWM